MPFPEKIPSPRQIVPGIGLLMDTTGYNVAQLSVSVSSSSHVNSHKQLLSSQDRHLFSVIFTALPDAKTFIHAFIYLSQQRGFISATITYIPENSFFLTQKQKMPLHDLHNLFVWQK